MTWSQTPGDHRETLLRGYADRVRDFEIETVDDAGHWIVEQQPGLVLDRLQAFLAGC